MPEKQYFEGVDIVSGGTVISLADVADTEARQSLDDLEDYVESITPVALSVTENGTYTAPTGVFGYSPVTVAVSKDFYPKADCELIDVTGVESDTMRVVPTAGTDYYPYVYLASKPYPSQVSDEWVPCGKRYNGQTTEHTVAVFLALIDPATGEAVSGYPQQISQTIYSIVDGGYCRIKNWTVSADGSQVSVTITRYNPTYTNPIDSTLTSATVPTGALDGYLTKPYKVEINKDNTAYTDVDASLFTDFTAPNGSAELDACNGVDAIKIKAGTDAVPVGTKVIIEPAVGDNIEYIFTEGLQTGKAVMWKDSRISDALAYAGDYIYIKDAGGSLWQNNGLLFSYMEKATT